ncbi:S8 family serine peptidase [Actinoplanes sp. NPDC024001]|uniref:S8 family serine peptidase n=1 Tax=Actinoplanes sp. NPDC024001 TaxID=3154598 RepID=UPI003402A8EA
MSAHSDAVQESQWHLAYLDLPQAHHITSGAGVTVGLPDSGVSPHLDLKDNLAQGTDTVPGGDGTGRTDASGHGTHMAGIIAGHSHGHAGDDGVLGIAPAAKILPVRTSSAEDGGPDLATGIKWAAENGARVINVSAVTARSKILDDAVHAANRADSVLVAAAGNNTSSILFGYPAAIPGVLAVGAINRSGEHASFSTTGPKVEICAPGSNIVTTALNNGYRIVSGTSAATAIVSGAAALVRSEFPELTAPEVIHRLTSTATDIGPPGRDEECGFGVLNVVKALTADVPPLGSSAGPGTGAPGSATASASAGGTAGARPEPESSGAVWPAVIGGGAAIIVTGTIVALLVSQRRRQPQ